MFSGALDESSMVSCRTAQNPQMGRGSIACSDLRQLPLQNIKLLEEYEARIVSTESSEMPDFPWNRA